MDNCGTILENFYDAIVASDVDILDVVGDNRRTILENTGKSWEFFAASLFLQIRNESLANFDVLDGVGNFNFSVVKNVDDGVVASRLENVVVTEYTFNL